MEEHKDGDREEVTTYHFRQFYIPARMMGAIRRYIDDGVLPGHFLRAIICNNLKEACGRADDENLANIPAFVAWFYNEAPSPCWGSLNAMMAWHDTLTDAKGAPKGAEGGEHE